jgi:hypothetical protein
MEKDIKNETKEKKCFNFFWVIKIGLPKYWKNQGGLILVFKKAYLLGIYETDAKESGAPSFCRLTPRFSNPLNRLSKKTDYVKAGIIDRLVEPERMISFRYVVDDADRTG